MKKIFLIISLWGIIGSELLAPSVSFASGLTVSNETRSRDEEIIELHDRLAKGKIRSYDYPYEVTKSSSFITIYYLRSSTDITVAITDESGQAVYSNIVDPVVGTELVIDISHWEAGDYILSFTDPAGNDIYGSFEISD